MRAHRYVGIAIALGVGMVLGYAVRPSAQSTPGTVLAGSPAEASLRLFVESAGQDQVRVRFSRGSNEYIEDRQIELSVVPDYLVVRGTADMTNKGREMSTADTLAAVKAGTASMAI